MAIKELKRTIGLMRVSPSSQRYQFLEKRIGELEERVEIIESEISSFEKYKGDKENK